MSLQRPAPGELDPIETASRDEISALQLQRLKWSLQHAYDNVAHYRNAFDQAHSLTHRTMAGADHGLSEDRHQQAYTRILIDWVSEMVVGGIETTIPLFQDLLVQPDILAGDYHIHWLENWAKPCLKNIFWQVSILPVQW